VDLILARMGVIRRGPLPLVLLDGSLSVYLILSSATFSPCVLMRWPELLSGSENDGLFDLAGLMHPIL